MTVAPYKGLRPFEDSPEDVEFFFGREDEREIISANLMASRLTVLYGESGSGKSSVLRAGVAHHLRVLARRNAEEHGRPELSVAVFDAWKDDPVAGLVEAVAAAVRASLGDPAVEAPASGTLADRLYAWSELLDGDLYVILDGAEEYFLYHEGEEGQGTFAEEFPGAVRRPGLRASFLVALREDALGKLDRFKASIPNLFGNYLRLEHLVRDAGRRAIVGPVQRYNELEPGADLEIEPELVEAVLDEVEAGRLEIGQAGRGVVERRAAERRIETPFLQLVMRRIWDEEEAAGSRVLRLSTLRSLGGAEQIVRDHLDRALSALSAEDRDVAAAVFNHLVTPSGTKIAHEAGDLARYAGVPEEQLAPVLSTLTAERVLRPTAADNGRPRFEIYHDVLGDGVLAWRADHDRSRELERSRAEAARRHRRLLAVIGAAGVLLALMSAVTVFALVQRSDAQASAREARARQLSTHAISLLESDPELSLLLATRAAELAPSRQAEETLRTAYILSRERATLAARGPLTAAAYSPDGAVLVAASQDGSVRLFDAATRKLVRELSAEGGPPVSDAAFSGDGKRLVTAAADGSARVWDLRSGGRVLATVRHGAPMRTAALDPSGTRFVTTGGRSARLWRSDGSLVSSIQWGKPVTDAFFSPGGKLLAVTGNDSVLRLYDGTTGLLLRELDQEGRVTSAAFGPGGGLLVTTGLNETARIWSVGRGRLLRELKGHRGAVIAAAFSPRGSRIATASADGTGRIWNVDTGRLLASLLGHKGIVEAVAFSPDGNFVVTGSTDRTARVSKSENGDARALLAGHGDSVHSVQFSPDGREVLTASDDGTARVWDPDVQPQLEVIRRTGAPLAGAVFIPPGERILVAGPGSKALVIDAGNGRVVRTIPASGPVRTVAVSADGATMAVAGGRGATVVRPSGTSEIAGTSRITAVALARDGRIATGDRTGGVRIWTDEGKPSLDLSGHGDEITGIAFSPDGTRVAASSRDGTARIWDATTGEALRRLTGHRDAVTSVEFSSDGSRILTSSRDHDARVWDAETGRTEQVLRGHFGEVADASFGPDGSWILTAGPATVGLWRLGVQNLVLPYGFGGHEAPLRSAVFDPTGRTVLSTSLDGTVRTAGCTVCRDLGDLLALAKAQLAASKRTLTPEERERYGLQG